MTDFAKINELNEIEDTDLFFADPLPENCPQFIKNILESNKITEEGKLKFIGMFAVRYIKSETFRQITENCKFMFLNGNYIGIYKNLSDKVEFSMNKKISIEDAKEKQKIFHERKLKDAQEVLNSNENSENPNATKNILILCANNDSFIKKRWQRELSSLLNISKYQPYYLGDDLIESLPYRINGKLSTKLTLNKLDDIKFDIIFSEFCPNNIFNIKLEKILYYLLNESGIIISPEYSNNIILSGMFDFGGYLGEYKKLVIYNKRNSENFFLEEEKTRENMLKNLSIKDRMKINTRSVMERKEKYGRLTEEDIKKFQTKYEEKY